MAVTPDNFLQSANEIAANCSGEIAQRNALSRLYYAAYHRTCEVIAPDGKDRTAPGVGSRKPGMHRNYILQLEEADSGSLTRRIAVRMNTLYNSRKKADYELGTNITSGIFSVNVNLAAELFSMADQLSEGGKPNGSASQPAPDTSCENSVVSSQSSNGQRRPMLKIVK